MALKVGFYPGSFDPLTNGHVDVIERAARLVDRLVIGIGTHHAKTPMFSHEDRVKLLAECVRPMVEKIGTEITVVLFGGLTVDAAIENGAGLIIRGLRDTTDYNYEIQMAGMNYEMRPQVQTVFVPSSSTVRHISATLVRQIHQMDGDISSFVPEIVLKALKTL